MTLAEYRECLAMARRYVRFASAAEDLLHEALLVGIRAGRLEFTNAGDRAWLAGTMRNLAAETARSESRRRRRESAWSEQQPAVSENEGVSESPAPVLRRLTEGTRRVAVLALHGMNADEIRYVLGLKPPAFRQRLTSLRRALGALPGPLRAEALALAYSRPRRVGEARLDFGLIRRALLQHLRDHAGVGTHDPDGHLLAIRTR